jgi:hypothetical protein
MSSIAAGTTLTTALVSTGDTTGELVLKTNGTTTAITIDTSQNVAVVGQIVAAAGTALLPSITTTGDVNTGIFFSAANTVDIATDGVARAQINSAGDFAINSGYGSVATAYGCRAWVNFNGTGTPAIRGSGNVSSITDNGTGNYYVNLANSMPDTNYSVVVTKQNETSNLDSSVADAISSRLVNRIQLYTLEAGSVSDSANINVSVFR